MTNFSDLDRVFFKNARIIKARNLKLTAMDLISIDNQYSFYSTQLFKADYAIATTGNAGPTKGDENAEVGTVCIALATPKGVFSEEFHLGNHRTKVINKAVNKAFELLQKEIFKN